MKKDDVLHIRIDKELKEKLKKMADNEGLSVSSYVVRLIILNLRKED